MSERGGRLLLLRDYQREAVEAVRRDIAAGHRALLVTLPTGTGKTVVFATLARELGWPTLVLAHRDELVRQTVEKFSLVWPEASLGVVQGPLNDLGYRVTVASVQTVCQPRRLADLTRWPYGLVVVDEAHHAVAPTWRRVLQAVGAGTSAVLVGFTATAVRGDGGGLGGVFTRLSYARGIEWMVRRGYLAPPRGVRVRTNVNVDAAATGSDGDFADRGLEPLVNTANRNALIAEAFARFAASRKALVFCAGVRHAHDLAATFRAAGVAAEAVDGTLSLADRRARLGRFREGATRVVCNYGVLTEGYDEPSVDAVVVARPTKSRTLYTQMVGRGLRPYPGKADCLVLDVADQTSRHRLIEVADLFPSARGDGRHARRRGRRNAEASGETVTVHRVGEGLVFEDTSLFSPWHWLAIGGTWALPLPGRQCMRLVPEAGAYCAWHYTDEGIRVLTPRPVPLEWAQGVAEETARRLLGGKVAILAEETAWRDRPPTEAQRAALGRWGLPLPATSGEASDLIAKAVWERRFQREDRRIG